MLFFKFISSKKYCLFYEGGEEKEEEKIKECDIITLECDCKICKDCCKRTFWS